MWILIATVTYVLFLVVCILSYAVDYLTNVIQVDSFSQLLYTMQVSMGGAENTIGQILQGFFQDYIGWILVITGFYVYFLWMAKKVRKSKKEGKPIVFSDTATTTLRSTILCGLAAAVALTCSQIRQGYNVLGVQEYLEEQKITSTFYEDYYVSPNDVKITFPSKKKNLIHIYMESMESSYTDKKHGGGFEDDLIPNLTKIAKDNTDFSAEDDKDLNGANVTNKTSWTIAGLTAQTSGTPLGAENSEYTKDFDDDVEFMPNLVTLGDLLDQNGYTNVFMCGSNASYGGRANYFEQHGNYEIFDWVSAREDGYLPENYKEWWGFEDNKLYEFAKDKITELAESDEPFNFTMLTADTHFKNGYECEDCPDLYDEQYENVIACSDKKVAEFVKWIMQQDFYKDTVIIISGDHLSMDGLIVSETGSDYDRHSYFTVINGPKYTLDLTREYTTLDIFPTTLEALGVKIEGHRLGLGTSLYSDVPTLCEELGFDELNKEIAYHSDYYDQYLVAGDTTYLEAED